MSLAISGDDSWSGDDMWSLSFARDFGDETLTHEAGRDQFGAVVLHLL